MACFMVFYSIFGVNNDNLPETQLHLAVEYYIFCLTEDTEKSENPPWNIKTLKTATPALTRTSCYYLLNKVFHKTKSSTG